MSGDRFLDEIEAEALRPPTSLWDAITGPRSWERQRDLLVVRWGRRVTAHLDQAPQTPPRLDDDNADQDAFVAYLVEYRAHMAEHRRLSAEMMEAVRAFDEAHEDDIYQRDVQMYGRRRAREMRTDRIRYREERAVEKAAGGPIVGDAYGCRDCRLKAQRTGRTVYCMDAHREVRP